MPTLRPYQSRTVAEARAAVTAGARGVLIVAPTGAGKTAIAAHVAASHLARGQGRTVLGIVPRLELAAQMARVLRAAGLRVGVLAGDAAPGDLDAEAPVQIATVQTLQVRGVRPPATLVLADEAHHYASPEWAAVALYYRAASTVLGLTATPQRGDGRAMGDLFDALVVAASVRELTDEGWLVPATVIAPAERVTALARDPVEAYLEHGRRGGELRRAIFFARDMAHSRAIAEGLAAEGVAASSVESDLAPEVRRARVDAFAVGELRALVNVQILTEGFDDPTVEVVVLARGCSHAGTYLQAVGRALRPSPLTGKRGALVLDLMGACHDHGLPDDERAYTLDGTAIRVATAGDDHAIRQCAACGGVWRASLFVASTCPRCGHVAPARPDPRVRRAELAEVRAGHSSDVRAAALRELVGQARAKGYKMGWAMARFKARYHRWPTSAERAQAGE